jgi:protein involved in polysaccharide export with SLBB domain
LTEEHTLAPGDEFEIRFPDASDLNDRVIVGPEGHVSLQLVNDVAVGGLTVSQATALLNRRYAQIIRGPNLSITMRTYAPEEVYVDGWVVSPGLVRSDIPLTVERAIAQAGGARTGAYTDNILLLRRGDDRAVHYYQITLGDYGGVDHPGQDVMLRPYDVIYVPKTAIASVADFFATYIRSVPFYATLTLTQ